MYRYKKQKANNVERIKFSMMCCLTHRVKHAFVCACLCALVCYLDLHLKESQAVFLQSTLQVLEKFWSLNQTDAGPLLYFPVDLQFFHFIWASITTWLYLFRV